MSSNHSYIPQDAALQKVIHSRHRTGVVWRLFFIAAIIFALVALLALMYNVTREAFGVIAENYINDPDTLAQTYLDTDKPFDELTQEDLSVIASKAFEENEARLRILVLDWVLGVTPEDGAEKLRAVSSQTVGELLAEGQYPEELREKPIGNPPLTPAEYQTILVRNLDEAQLRTFVLAEVAQVQVARSWPLNETLLNYSEIKKEVETDPDLANSELKFRSWVNWDFLSQPMNSRPELAGVRTAILGSVWMIVLTILIAFPIGIGAAIYLEEYAQQNRLNSLIQTNIYNLAGVPSIVYGILGLAVFVRLLSKLTSGQVISDGLGPLGIDFSVSPNGRTLLSASLTMAILILPILIINAQEAIRSVPNSIRQASYGLGATKWQTVWNHVLPSALPGIMTGTILAISRAIGETAPLIVVGAATYITVNPETPFSRFTVLPMQIYRWSFEPQKEFKDAAAAAIVVLLVILLSLNSFAIVLRNRFSRR
jgi:phosphate transport system permease protein